MSGFPCECVDSYRSRMRLKNIALVGGSLIATLFLLSGFMYYFSQDECPDGTFLCWNSTVCKAQRSWCNGIDDCPHGDDESEDNCLDLHGNWDWLKDRDSGTMGLVTCDSLEVIENCTVNKCRVNCTDYFDVPWNLPANVTHIILTDNRLTRITKNSLFNYPELRSLYLDNNFIVEFEVGAFSKQAKLIWLILTKNKISEIRTGQLIGLNSLESLRLNENQLRSVDLSDLADNPSVEMIDLRKNKLTASRLIFPHLPSLKELMLDDNLLEIITAMTFSEMPQLKSLSLEGNHIKSIEENAFLRLEQLEELNLASNHITAISPNIFQSMRNLTKLNGTYVNVPFRVCNGFTRNHCPLNIQLMGYNPIENMPVRIFEPVKNLRSLGVEEIDMNNFERDAFHSFKQLDFVYFKKFHYCATYASKVQKCRPNSDGVSSLSHLLGKPLLRAAVWGISCVTCLGNALVLWGRFTAKDENRVLGIVIRNLAVSDMLMGVYLFIIALEDVRFRDNYNQMASTWMSSWSCTLVGALAMTSSEVSVLILSFMSVERFMLIAAPLSGHRAMTSQTAASSLIVIWVVGIVLAVVPVIHWRSSTRFYGVNGMCFPLHIDDPFVIGWQYSAFIFLGLNLLGLVTIFYVYVAMFASIWRTRHATPLSVGESEFALRFFLIVLTDAACWAPIIALKIVAMLKYPVAADLHAWVVVFILPVNSAVNPLLYTFTTPKFRERLSDGWFGKMRSYVSRKQSAQETSQISAGSTGKKNMMLALSIERNCSLEKKLPIADLNGGIQRRVLPET